MLEDPNQPGSGEARGKLPPATTTDSSLPILNIGQAPIRKEVPPSAYQRLKFLVLFLARWMVILDASLYVSMYNRVETALPINRVPYLSSSWSIIFVFHSLL